VQDEKGGVQSEIGPELAVFPKLSNDGRASTDTDENGNTDAADARRLSCFYLFDLRSSVFSEFSAFCQL